MSAEWLIPKLGEEQKLSEKEVKRGEPERVLSVSSRAVLAVAIALTAAQAIEPEVNIFLPPELPSTKVLVPSAVAAEMENFNEMIKRTNGFDHFYFLPLVMNNNPTEPLGVDPNDWRCVGVPAEEGGPEMLADLTNVRSYITWSHLHDYWEDSRWTPLIYGREVSLDNQAYFDQLAALAESHQGRIWYIFNEPDISGQTNLSPQEGAALYERIYDAIKGVDPTAKLFYGGVAFANPDWLEQSRPYLTRPVDGIHFHGYPCSNSDSEECVLEGLAWYDRFNTGLMFDKLNAFYRYLQSRPEFRDRPIHITEIGILGIVDYGGDSLQKTESQVMEPLIDYLQGEGGDKFERVCWFATRSWLSASDLAKQDNTLTRLGQTWNNSPNP